MRTDRMTEEELAAYTEKLIWQTESAGLVPAPGHMTQEILGRSRGLDYQIRVQTRQIPKKLQFFYYSLKVGAAVVMALFLVMMVPREMPDMSGAEAIAVQQEESLGNKVNRGMQTVNRMLDGVNFYLNGNFLMED